MLRTYSGILGGSCSLSVLNSDCFSAHGGIVDFDASFVDEDLAFAFKDGLVFVGDFGDSNSLAAADFSDGVTVGSGDFKPAVAADLVDVFFEFGTGFAVLVLGAAIATDFFADGFSFFDFCAMVP